MASYFIPLTWLLIFKDVLCLTVDVSPKQLVVKEGETVKMLCQVGSGLEYCRIVVPGEEVRILSPTKRPIDGISYYGAGLNKGQCGVEIARVKAKHNGLVNCSMSTPTESRESRGSMDLIVARAPERPELSWSMGAESKDYYKEGESVSLSCVIRNGRPAANISWYLGDQKIIEGLQQPTIYDKASDDLYTVEQNLTRVLQASDNGKSISCVADHPLLESNENAIKKQLNVRFPPKPSLDTIEYFGLVEGEEGKVAVVVKANPQPAFVWTVGDQSLNEGESDPTGRFKVKPGYEDPTKGAGNWESILIISPLMKEDVDKKYVLTASNKLGDETYRVVISTSPEPKMLELGAGTIAIICVAVLVLLTLTAILVFARAKGRWCFGGKAGRNTGESSDTESAEHHGENKSKIFNSVFKKKSDKVSADPPKTKDVTVNDEKVGEDDADDGKVSLKPKNEDGLVYAELDLQNTPASRGLLVRPENDKTEYAEIIHTKDNK